MATPAERAPSFLGVLGSGVGKAFATEAEAKALIEEETVWGGNAAD